MYQFCLGIFTYDTLTLNSYVFSFILAFILKIKKKKTPLSSFCDFAECYIGT